MWNLQQKRIALINDLTGFGRCSLAVSLPILSVMGIECCPLPTAVLSNHTGFESYFLDDYTDKILPYFEEWKKLDLHFDAVYTGFLGSERQAVYINHIFEALPDTVKMIVDPAMADNGQPYASCNAALCASMRTLVSHADVVTPNLTEACILTDTVYTSRYDEGLLQDLCCKLKRLGAKNIVITGLESKTHISNYIMSGKNTAMVSSPKRSVSRAGTGDVFSSIVAGNVVNNVDLYTAVRQAADFVEKAMELSDCMNIPPQCGICFEQLLNDGWLSASLEHHSSK